MSSASTPISYSEYTKSALNIWKHFLRANDGQSVKCKKCHKILKIGGGTTTGLYTHLRSKHPEAAFPTNSEPYSESAIGTSRTSVTPCNQSTPADTAGGLPTTSTNNINQGKKRKLITDYFKADDYESMETVVSRMAALDGVNLNVFCKSVDLRYLFKKSGYDLPTSSNTIAKIVLDHAECIKIELKANIAHMKQEGIKFTVTLDEWTSLRNRRYMKINLHSTQFGGLDYKNLGLVRIFDSTTALDALEILGKHLSTFNISIDEDVVGITTDGASMMKEMGTFFHGHHQLCLAHGLQLAVIDTVYTDPEDNIFEPAIDIEIDPISSESDSSSDEDEDFDYDGRFVVEVPRVRADPYVHKELIYKLRRVIKMIRQSPLKSDALQAYVTEEFNQNIQLHLDCHTRWSSMSDMIGSFLKIKTCVLKVLSDFESEESFTEEEISCLLDLHQCLEIVKVTVSYLCRCEATLHTADVALKFMLKKLEQLDSSLSLSLSSNLRERIKERRLLLAGVLHYLHYAEGFNSAPHDETFRKPTSDEICGIVVNLLQNLKYKGTSSIELSANTLNNNHTAGNSQTFQEEAHKCKNRTTEARDFDLRGFVVAEKEMYDNRGVRGVYLTEAYNYLLTIRPASIDNARIFTAAGHFCNKIESSLSDRLLDALSFLRTHFQEERF